MLYIIINGYYLLIVLHYLMRNFVFAELFKCFELTLLDVIKTATSRRCSLQVVTRLTASPFSSSVPCQEKIVKFKSSKRIHKDRRCRQQFFILGERRHKTDKVFEALGDVDELACQIRLAREITLMSSNEHPFVEKLVRVHCILQDINSGHARLQRQGGPQGQCRGQ